MKKIVMSVMAVCFACCMVSAADALKINGDFKSVNPKTNTPHSWITNGSGRKDLVFSIVKEDNANALKFVSKGKYATIFTASTHKSADDAKYEVILVAKGKAAAFRTGAYIYDGKNRNINVKDVVFKIDSPDKFTQYKGVFTITPTKKGKAATIRAYMGSYLPYDLIIKEFKVIPVAAK